MCSNEELETKLNQHIKSQAIYERDTAILLNDIKKSLEEIKPTYRMIKNVETTGQVLGKTGRALLSLIVIASAFIGAIYSLKEWIKR